MGLASAPTDDGKCLLLLILFCALTPVLSQAATLLLKGATVHTVSGETLSNGDLLIRDGKIAEIAPRIQNTADQVLFLDQMHLYPGLIAASTSLGLIEIEAVRATRDLTEVGTYTPDVQSWIAVNPDSELIPVARANGITHVLPVPAGGIVSGQSGLIVLSGWTSEEMAVKAPVALHLFWPKMELDTRSREEFEDKSKWKSLEDQGRERRAKLKEIDQFFEDARSYAHAREAHGGPAHRSPSAKRSWIPNPAWEAMLPYVRGEIPLMIHADELRQLKSAVEWADARGHRIIIAGGKDAWMLAGLLAEKKIPVVYERIFNQANGSAPTPVRDDQPYDLPFRAPEMLRQAGVQVIFSEGLGGDAASTIRNLPYSVAQAIAFGYPEAEALKAITLYPAQLLGVHDRLGSLEPGKEATLFAVDGDLFDIRSNVKRLWIAGKEVSLESRHTRLYQKYKSRPKTGRPSNP